MPCTGLQEEVLLLHGSLAPHQRDPHGAISASRTAAASFFCGRVSPSIHSSDLAAIATLQTLPNKAQLLSRSHLPVQEAKGG